jgi:hypothetical protein
LPVTRVHVASNPALNIEKTGRSDTITIHVQVHHAQ